MSLMLVMISENGSAFPEQHRSLRAAYHTIGGVGFTEVKAKIRI